MVVGGGSAAGRGRGGGAAGRAERSHQGPRGWGGVLDGQSALTQRPMEEVRKADRGGQVGRGGGGGGERKMRGLLRGKVEDDGGSLSARASRAMSADAPPHPNRFQERSVGSTNHPATALHCLQPFGYIPFFLVPSHLPRPKGPHPGGRGGSRPPLLAVAGGEGGEEGEEGQ